jgi:hypothetical protein
LGADDYCDHPFYAVQDANFNVLGLAGGGVLWPKANHVGSSFGASPGLKHRGWTFGPAHGIYEQAVVKPITRRTRNFPSIYSTSLA